MPGELSDKSFLLLHGWENRRPAGHWQHWLATQLADTGAQVLYPQLPEPDQPVLDEWLADLGRYAAAMRGEEKVVVAHSLAVMLWWSAALSDSPVAADRVLLVAPPSPALLRERTVAEFVPAEIETRHVDPTIRTTVRVVASDNDPYCPEGATGLYTAIHAMDIDIVPGAGHLNPEAGYGPWPSVRQWCLDGSTRIGGR